LLEKEKPAHRQWARVAKLTVGWTSHLYYWIYPGIMVAFVGTLFGYIFTSLFDHTLSYFTLGCVVVVFSAIVGYIAYRGITGSTMTAIVINVIQITSLLAVSVLFISYRFGHGGGGWEFANAGKVIIPHSFSHMLYQSTIAILLLVGFESITALGAEARNPQRDIRRGVLISLAIQGATCYLVEYFAANFATGHSRIPASDGTSGFAAAANDPAPIGTMIKTIGDKSLGGSGTSISLIVAVTVLLALIGTTLACLNTGVRVSHAMSR